MLFLMGLLLGPFIVVNLGKAWRDGGWALGRVAYLLLIGLIVWQGAHIVPINTMVGVMSVGGVMMLGLLWWNLKNRERVREEIKKIWPMVLAEEVLFLIGFGWLAWVRGHNPDVLDLEKFMDNGFIASYLRADKLPAIDMWLAGEKINYYTFGHFLGSIMVRIWGVDLSYAYNLLLAMIMGMGLMMAFSVIVNLIGDGETKTRKVIVGGVVGSLLLNIGGNSHAFWYFLSNRGFLNYWYADATRFIENTIHEFPSYSYIVSDLHAHVWGLPLVLGFLLIVFAWIKALEKREHKSVKEIVGWAGAMGVLVGTMAMTNTWDVLIYAMLVSVISLVLLALGRVKMLDLVMSGLVVFVVAACVGAAWWVNFVSIEQGVKLVTKRSPLWQLLVLWLGQVVIMLIAVAKSMEIKRNKKGVGVVMNEPVIVAIAIGVVILLLIPEVIYFKDIYPSHPRANTMFKFTYQGFMLMSLIGGWLVGKWEIGKLKGKRLIINLVGLSLVTVVMGGLLMFPYFGYRDYYGALKVYKGLDGLTWMRAKETDDYALVNYLKTEVKGRPVILEAVGESYTEFARMSAMSGLPTVLGWRVHEWLWRGGFEIAGKRTEEVKVMYEQPGTKQASELYDLYKVKYVIVGNKERMTYKLNDKALEKLGKVVFSSNKSKIIEISD